MAVTAVTLNSFSSDKPDYGKALWSMALVMERLDQAAGTLRDMRLRGMRPQGYRVAWPDVVQSVWEAGLTATVEFRPALPLPAAIDKADEVLGWLLLLDERQRRLVWARANGAKWKRIGRAFGKSERCVQLWHRAAILCLVERLIQNPVAPFSRKVV